jgi:hypothetical protein
MVCPVVLASPVMVGSPRRHVPPVEPALYARWGGSASVATTLVRGTLLVLVTVKVTIVVASGHRIAGVADFSMAM